MKICWDNIENLKYIGNGIWCKKYTKYIYMGSCKNCNESYLTQLSRQGDFCSVKCSVQGKNNPMYGKKHTEESKMKNRNSNKNIHKKIGKESPNWRGGVSKNNIPLYNTYAHQLSYAEEVRRNKEDRNILEVKCTYCGKWHINTMNSVIDRIRSLNGKIKGENKLYCSDECKQECPVFWQKKYKKGEKPYYHRDTQSQLREMVLERDKHQCVKCESKENLVCHHKEGIRWEPLESADIDKCITVCKICDKKIHSIEGCRPVDMQCDEKYREVA